MLSLWWWFTRVTAVQIWSHGHFIAFYVQFCGAINMPIQHRFCPLDQLFWASMNYASQFSVFHYGVVVIELSIFLHKPEKLSAGLRMKCICNLQEVSDKESSSLKLHKVKRMPRNYQSFTSKKFQTEHSLIKFLNIVQTPFEYNVDLFILSIHGSNICFLNSNVLKFVA